MFKQHFYTNVVMFKLVSKLNCVAHRIQVTNTIPCDTLLWSFDPKNERMAKMLPFTTFNVCLQLLSIFRRQDF